MEDEIVWKIASLDVGSYLFWFVESKEERRLVMIPYLSQGVARGEKLLVFGTKSFFQSNLAEEIRGRLNDEGLPATGQLNAFILSEADTSTRDGKGPDDLVRLIRSEMNRGLEEGYPAVRVLVEMDAMVQKCLNLPRLLEFEREIGDLFSNTHSLGLMVLDTSRVEPGALTSILMTQKQVGICGEIYRNSQIIAAEKIQTTTELSAAILHRTESMFKHQPVEQPAVEGTWYRHAFDVFPGLVAILHTDGRLLDINRAGADIARKSPVELIGKPLWDAPVWQTSSQEWLQNAVERARGGEVCRGEIRVQSRRKDNPVLAVSLSPVIEETGQVVSLLCTARDRTALDALSQRVVERDDLIRAAVEGAPLILFWVDPNGLIRYSNGVIGQGAGKKPSRAVVGRSIHSVYADYPEVERQFERALKGEKITTRLEIGGSTFEVTYTPVFGEHSELRGVVGSAFDVSRLVWVEDALYRSEERGRMIMLDARVGTFTIDLTTFKFSVNPILQDLLSYGEEELPGLKLVNLVHPEDLGRVADSVKGLENGENDYFQDEFRVFSKSGACFWVHTAITRYGGRHAEAPFVVGIVDNITERKQEEDTLRSQGRLLRSVLDRVPIGIWITDAKGQIITSNPAAAEIWGGLKPADMQELYQVPAIFPNTGHHLAPEDWALARVLRDGETVLGDVIEISPPDGGRRIVINSAVPIFDEDHQLVAAIAVNQDITEQKQVEKELAEVQRQLMVRSEAERLRLAQDLHDGPIQDLYGITFQLHELDEALAHTEFEPIANAIIDTLQVVIATLRTMCTEMRPPTLAPFGLEKAIRSHAESFQRRNPGLEVHLDLMPDGQILSEDVRMGLFRIYQELLNNVFRHAKASAVTVHFHLEETQAQLEVEDNGQGFEVPRRWVEVVRRGHYGLVGLQERAEALGGSVKIVSAVGQGTTVMVIVPRPAAGNNVPAAGEQKSNDGE
jgi:PAS domain S-box-containing protein